ncbi:MAG: hypothetical protein AB1635_15490 [Acidobacteriota bacterium]
MTGAIGQAPRHALRPIEDVHLVVIDRVASREEHEASPTSIPTRPEVAPIPVEDRRHQAAGEVERPKRELVSDSMREQHRRAVGRPRRMENLTRHAKHPPLLRRSRHDDHEFGEVWAGHDKDEFVGSRVPRRHPSVGGKREPAQVSRVLVGDAHRPAPLVEAFEGQSASHGVNRWRPQAAIDGE